MSKDLNNPVNRLLRCLGEIASGFAEEVNVKPRTFEDLSQEKPPIKLMGKINNKLGIRFVKEQSSPVSSELTDAEKKDFVTALLRKGRKRHDRYGELLLKNEEETVIWSEVSANGGIKFLVNDLRTGTPTSGPGNLLSREFSTLLRGRSDWMNFLSKISMEQMTKGGVISFDKIWAKYDSKHPKGNRELFLQECANEAFKQGLDKWNLVRTVLDPLIDFFELQSLFAKLKALHRRSKVLNEREQEDLGRYQDEFMDQYDLSPKMFELAMACARIGLVDEDAENTKKKKKRYPQGVNLRVALLFVDEAMGSPPEDAKQKKPGKK